MMKKIHYPIVLSSLLILALVLGLAFGAVSTVQAAEINNGGTINKSETINDDLILTGNNVIMDGTVNGLLFAAGQSVTIDGTVNGDLIAVGQDIVIADTAKITGNIFFGGSSVELRGKVTGSVFGGSASFFIAPAASIGRNLYYGGYGLEMRPSTTIERDLYFGGYQLSLGGEVGRNVNAAGGAIQVTGKIGGDAIFDVGTPTSQARPMMFMPSYVRMPAAVPAGLSIDSNASIGGKLTYTSQVDQTKAIQVQPAGGVVYQTPVPGQNEGFQQAPRQSIEVRFPILGWFFNLLRNMVTLLILGGLVIWLIPALLRRTADQALAQPLPSGLYGLLVVIVGYLGSFVVGCLVLALAVLIGLLSLGGLGGSVFGVGFSSLATVMAVFSLLVGYGSKLVVAYLGGEAIMKALFPKAPYLRIWAMVIGVVIYAILRSIPFLGWVIGVLVTLVGLGAMWLAYRAWRKPAAATA